MAAYIFLVCAALLKTACSKKLNPDGSLHYLALPPSERLKSQTRIHDAVYKE
jgi:hypothetical protein